MQNLTRPKLFALLSTLSALVAVVFIFFSRTDRALIGGHQPHVSTKAAILPKVVAANAAAGLQPADNLSGKVSADTRDRKDVHERELGDLREKETLEDPDEKGKYDKKALVEGAYKLEFRKTRDAQTNTIPKYRLAQAVRFADNLKARRLPGTMGPITGLTWVERGPFNIGGRTRCILPDLNDATGNTVWAGSVGGGLWKTTNALSSAPHNPVWTPVNDFFQNLAISCITQNPQNPQLIYFGTGEGWYNGDAIAGDGIWKTSDGGNTWSQLLSTTDSASNKTFYHVQKILDYTANGKEYLFACTRGQGVQLSKNGGATWVQCLGPKTDVSISAGSAADIVRGADGSLYAALGIFQKGGIYKSQDNGATWVQLKKNLPTAGYERIALACAPSDSLRVYALLQDSASYTCKGVYRSDSAGRVWKRVTTPTIYGGGTFAGNQAWYALAIAIDPNNAGRVTVGGLDLAASQDSGKTWKPISQWYGGGGYQYVHADHHAIVYDPRGSNIVYFGNDGGVFASKNGQATTPTITQIDSTYNVTQFYHAAISPLPNEDYMIAGAQDNGNIQFTQAGKSPGLDFTGGDGAYVHIDDNNPKLQIAAYVYGNYYVSKDGFTTQTYQQVTVNGGSSGLFINPTDYDSRDKTLYGSDNAGSYHTITNVGTTNNTQVVSMPSFTSQVTAIKVSPNTRQRVFFGLADGTLFRVDNASASVPDVTQIDGSAFPSSYLSCITVEPGNDNHLLVCFSNYGLQGKSVYETKDGGSSWVSIAGNLPDMPIRAVSFKPFSNTEAIVATELGIWSTGNINGSATEWGESNTGLSRVSTYWVDYRKSDGTLFAATHGRGLFTSNSFKKPVISFVTSDTLVNRSDAFTQGAACAPYYADFSIPVQLSSAPTVGAQVSISVSSHALVKGIDYDVLTTGNLTFSAAGRQNIKIRLYNNPATTANDTLSIALALVNGGATNAILTPFPSFNIFSLAINNTQGSLPIQTAVDTLTSPSQSIGANRTAYFYDGSPANHLVASIKNNSNTAMPCIKLAVDRAGNAANVPFNVDDPAHYLASKTVRLVYGSKVASGLDYTLTLYYTKSEIATWLSGTTGNSSALRIVGVKNHVMSDVTPATPLTGSVFITSSTLSNYSSTGYAYSVNLTSADSLQGFGLGDSAMSTLPISLLSFKGTPDKENVLLTWKTVSETNNKGFAVQRSLDGRTFSQIGFVNGHGTTGLVNNYMFTDDAVPAQQQVYYRLKQVDYDGRYGVSNIVVVTKSAGDNNVSVTENPIRSQLTLAFKGLLTGTANVSLYDMSGKKLYAASQKVQATMPINTANISRGIYLVRVEWNNKSYTIKVVKN